jgi:acyl-CoA thioesterase
MESASTAKAVLQKMLQHDKFTAWLGLKIDAIDTGYCKLHYEVKDDMLNGFNSIHGGVLFSASDSAFAFACNSHGILTVALDVSITFTRPAKTGDMLTVEAKEINLSNRTGLYDIKTYNENKELICYFKGTAYRTSKTIL